MSLYSVLVLSYLHEDVLRRLIVAPRSLSHVVYSQQNDIMKLIQRSAFSMLKSLEALLGLLGLSQSAIKRFSMLKYEGLVCSSVLS